MDLGVYTFTSVRIHSIYNTPPMPPTNRRLQPREIRLKKAAEVITMHGKLSLVQHKMFNALLLHAYHSLPKQALHSIPLTELCRTVGYNSKNRDPIHAALRGLAITAVEWGDPTDDDGPWVVSTMLAQAEIRGGMVTYEYSTFMRGKLYNPAVYAAINLTYAHRFRGAYTLRLYEICERFRRVGSTGWKPIPEWKSLLGLEPAQYPAYKALSRTVLRPAVRSVNKLSDLHIVMETQKRGHGGKVHAIRFLIKPNPQLAMPLPAPPPELEAKPLPDFERPALSPASPQASTDHMARLCALGLTHQQAEALTRSHDVDHIIRNIAFIEMRLRLPEHGGIENPAAYTHAAIAGDWAAAALRATDYKEQLGQEQERAQEARRLQEAARVEREEQERGVKQARLEELDKAWAALSPDMKAAIEHTALDCALTEPLVRQWYQEDIAKGGELRPTVRYTILGHRNKALEEVLGIS